MKTTTRPLLLSDITPEALAAFSKERGEPEWLTELRARAFQQYVNLPWPETKDERWKRTDWKKLNWDALSIATTAPILHDSAGKLTPTSLGWDSAEAGNGGPAIRFTWDTSKGYFSEIAESEKEFVEFIDLESAVQLHAERLQAAWSDAIESAKSNKFLSLTLALANGGSFLMVPKGRVNKAPIHNHIVNDSNGQALFPLHFVFLEEAAEAHIWEQLSGKTSGGEKKSMSLISSFTSIQLKENSKANFYFLQNWDEQAVHFQFQDVTQGAFSRYTAISVALGGAVTHSESTVHLQGQGAENKVLGVIYGDKEQNFVNWITQNHTAPKTLSDIQYRGALDDSSHSFFSGMVYINKEAQLSDAYQGAKFLLLSREAKADAIPNLEILADDVKCSHGAAVGPVDEDQKFYLQTRGIPPSEAERIIIQGFIEPVISELPSPSVQEKLRSFVERKMNKS